MTKALHTTEEMANALDWAINSGPVLSGRVDAIAHVGKLLNGEWTQEFLTDVQAANFEDGEPGYIKGYTEVWNVLFGAVSGVSIDELHKA